MGECMFSRAHRLGGDAIPIVPGACVLNVQVIDAAKQPIPNVPVQCVDGDKTLKYVSNSMGMIMFIVNNASCTLSANNWLNNGVRLIDHSTTSINLQTQIDKVVNYKLEMTKAISANLNTAGTHNVIMLAAKSATMNLSGGGGGASGTSGLYRWHASSDCWRLDQAGELVFPSYPGGNGVTNIKTISFTKGTKYSIIIAKGGNMGTCMTTGGYIGSNIIKYSGTNYAQPGNAGGTSTAFGYSALGGGGGIASHLNSSKYHEKDDSYTYTYNGGGIGNPSGNGANGGESVRIASVMNGNPNNYIKSNYFQLGGSNGYYWSWCSNSSGNNGYCHLDFTF